MVFISCSNSVLFLAKVTQRLATLIAMISLSFYFLYLSHELLVATFSLPNFSNLCGLPTIDQNPLFQIHRFFGLKYETFIYKEVFNILILLLFCIHHSLMAREESKNFMMLISPNYVFFERSFYLLFAAFSLSLNCILHQPDPEIFLDFSHPIINMIFTILLLLHVLLNLFAFLDMGEADIVGFGLIKIFEENKGTHIPINFRQKPPSLLSKMMRHPIYYCATAEIWLSSTKISYGRIIFNLIMTVFVILGTFMEEKEIIKKYPSYLEHIKEVPNKFFPDLTQLFKSQTKRDQ